MSALVAAATAAMGHAVRDAKLLTRLLHEVNPSDVVAHRALAVSLAVLGHVPSLEVVWPNPSDDMQAELYFACLALAEDTETERVRLATIADQRAAGNAVFTSEAALARIESGLRLSVVD